MDGRRFFVLWMLPAAIFFAGCTTTRPTTPAQAANQKAPPAPPTLPPNAAAKAPRPDDIPVIKKQVDGPKRNPMPATEIAFGKMKEAEADSEAIKKQPQIQAAMRDDARKAYQQALKLDPNNQEATRCLARLYVKIGDFERAQDIYKKALAKHPKDAALWYDLGMCHNRRREFNDAMRCFTRALELDPENREYLKKLGFTLAWVGQVDQGLLYLTRANQSAALAHFQIACMFDQKEHRSAAIHHLRLALRDNSQLVEARDLLEALENPNAPRVRRVSLESPISDR